MSRLRVLRVIARMNVGGPALQVVALSRGLDPERFEQRLLIGQVGPGEADYLDLRAPDVAAVRVPGLGRSPDALGDAKAWWRLRREMRAFRPHIVHTHTAKAGVLGRTAAATAGVPATVHTFHGHLLHGYFSPTVTKAVVLTERTLAWRTTRLVAVGRQVRDDLLAARIGRPAQYRIVPPGVNLPPVPDRTEARRRLGLPLDRPVVAFVARLTAVKRPDRFATMARMVAARRPDVRFAVAGEGAMLGALRGQMTGVPADFLGWRPDVETVYGAADLTVLTSDNEGMPVSLIEAAWCGCPAVTTSVGSAGEVVLDGKTGLVCALDAGTLADAVVALLDDPARREAMGMAAADHAHAAFSESRLVADTAEIYEAVAAEKGLP